MVTDQILEDFEAWYPPPGIPISREAAWAAYQKGQEDLITAIGKPVAYDCRGNKYMNGVITVDHFRGNLHEFYKFEEQAGLTPLYKLPEGVKK